MKVRTSGMRGFALMALSALAFTACEDKTPTEIVPPAVTVSVVPQSASLQVGQTQDFAAIVANASNTAVTWASSNSSVASVSANGRVTAVAAGSAIITATSQQDPTKVGAASVVVTAAPIQEITLQLLPSTATISQTGTVQLTTIVTGTSNTGATYTSSNPAAATVNATGLVTGVAPGTTTIIARSAANTAVVDESVITVIAGTPGQTVTITITPTQATIGPNATQTFVATVGGTSNTAVTWASSDTAVATINSSGVATAKGAGTTVITATSVADSTKSVTATLTVSASIQPSISIQSVSAGTGLFATPVSSGATVFGPVEVKVNVSAGTNTNIERVEIRLTNSATPPVSVVGCRQTFSPPLAPTQGVAQITCVVDTAELDPVTGAPKFPNGIYTLTAVAISGNADVATATFGTLNLQNANRVAGLVEWDNDLDDVDNDPEEETKVDNGGNVWYGGAAKVTLTPAIFQGTQIATIKVSVVANCGGAETVVATRTATITNNSGSVTFPEQSGTGFANNIDGVENNSVCFRVFDARDANNASVPLSGTAGTGNVTSTGSTLNPTIGDGQNQYRVDNVEPTFVAAPMTLDPADFDGLTTKAFIGIGESFARSGTSPTNILNASATDGGVGGVRYKMYAVRNADFGAADAPDQAGLAAAVAHANTQEFTTADDLTPTLNADEYVLVVEAKDALGNVRYKGNRNDLQFGVDLSPPTIAVVEGSSEPASSINNPDGQMRYRFRVTDEGSGAEGVRGTVRGHSVFEIDANVDVDIRCYAYSGALIGDATSSGSCATQSSTGPVFTEGAVEFYDVIIPTDENFYEFTVSSFDAARNQSTVTITRDALIDETAGPDAVGSGNLAAVQINEYTINNVNNTASVTGIVRDNIEVREYDARFEFAGLMANDAVTDLPDAVPFTTPLTAGAYGLPLVGQVGPTTITTAVNVDRIARNPQDVAPYVVTEFGFGMKDVAANFTYDGVAVPAGTYNGFPAEFQTFTLEATAGAAGPFVIDRTPGGSGRSGSTTLTAIATTAVGATSPLSRVYFYYVNPGADLVYGTGNDDHLTLIAEPVSSPTVLTGETVREFRYNQTLAASMLPANVAQFMFRVVAIGVDAQGDAVMTEVELVEVYN